jgi:Fur family ferric uptake transcriptional regulator
MVTRGNAADYTWGALHLSKPFALRPAHVIEPPFDGLRVTGGALRRAQVTGGRPSTGLRVTWEWFLGMVRKRWGMGIRSEYVTRPREQISGVLQAEKRFVSAAEIHRALESEQAKVSLSTVYRTLEHLMAKGEVTVRIDDAGESTYMLCEPERHHHHAICRVCGKVDDVDCTVVEQFSESLLDLHGFELDGHKMEFMGRCRACR